MAVGGPKGRKGRIVTFLTICKFVNLHKKINFQPILLPGEEDRGLPLLRESPLSLDPTSPPRWMSFFTYSACLLFQDTQRHEFGSNLFSSQRWHSTFDQCSSYTDNGRYTFHMNNCDWYFALKTLTHYFWFSICRHSRGGWAHEELKHHKSNRQRWIFLIAVVSRHHCAG